MLRYPNGLQLAGLPPHFIGNMLLLLEIQQQKVLLFAFIVH